MGHVRGAAAAVPRAAPLTLVSGAVAGDDLHSVAGSASAALGLPVAIVLPARAGMVVSPPAAADPKTRRDLLQYAKSISRGHAGRVPSGVSEAVPVPIGTELVGVIAALGLATLDSDQRAWLEAAAAAAAVSVVMRQGEDAGLRSARQAFVLTLASHPPADPDAAVAQAQRLSFDLSAGAVAVCARGVCPQELEFPGEALVAAVDGRILALLPPASDPEPMASALRAVGMAVAVSVPRRDPGAVHGALREAELMLELTARADMLLTGQEETYRLLIGVLERAPEELEQLRAHTVLPLARYDEQHDAELLATLHAFLAHDGSTTETAEAMQLHRHTVGYRLTRVHEVSGLSPYESDGRERLSLGLKADQILAAANRRGESI